MPWTSPDPKGINKMIVVLLKNAFWHILFDMSKYIPWTQEMCNEVVHIEPYALEFIPDHFKTQKMCNEAVEAGPCNLKFVPDHVKTQEMCEKAIEKDPWILKFVSDHLKTQEMC